MDVLSWVPEIRKNSNLPTGGVGFLHVGAFFLGGLKKKRHFVEIDRDSNKFKKREAKTIQASKAFVGRDPWLLFTLPSDSHWRL